MTEGRQADTAASANESAWPISTPSAWLAYETEPGPYTGSGYEQLGSGPARTPKCVVEVS